MLIGVTGGIGAGKSTVLSLFEELGEPTIDSDALVHQLYAEDAGLRDALVQRWGQHVLDRNGLVDRRQVAAKVFGCPRELAWLNARVHPLVRLRLQAQAKAWAGRCFCAVPLLFEVGWDRDMAATLSVWCDRQTQLERLRRRGWSDAEIRSRNEAQMDMDVKMRQADFALINNGTLASLKEQCRRLLLRLNNEE